MYFQVGEKDSYLQIAKSPLAKELFALDGVKSKHIKFIEKY